MKKVKLKRIIQEKKIVVKEKEPLFEEDIEENFEKDIVKMSFTKNTKKNPKETEDKTEKVSIFKQTWNE